MLCVKANATAKSRRNFRKEFGEFTPVALFALWMNDVRFSDGGRTMKPTCRTTFREILEAVREQAGVHAWERACTASKMRRGAAARGDRRSARRLSKIKSDAIQLVATILPEKLKISLDSDYYVGLVSVRLEGHGRLHLPASSVVRKFP